MKKLVLVCAALFLAIPLLFSADKDTSAKSQEDVKTTVQDLISTKVLLQKDGVRQLQTVSANLSAESKNEIFDKNKKVPAIIWLNLVLPSLGSWLVGDTGGALAAVIGGSIGIVVTGVGGVTMLVGVIEGTYLTYYNTRGVYDYSDSAKAAIAIMIVGLGVFLGTDILSVLGSYNFVEQYNTDLKTGLGITELKSDNGAFLKQKRAFVRQNEPAGNDLVHFDLLTYRF